MIHLCSLRLEDRVPQGLDKEGRPEEGVHQEAGGEEDDKHRAGGLHAVSGSLPSGGSDSARLTVLGIILRSKGLPETYAQAKFCL